MCQNCAVNIVFVHLNTTLPKYLKLNLSRHIKVFPEHQITLIHNGKVNPPKIEGLDYYLYEEDDRWKRLESLYGHPKDFRGNFWLTSSARFFALDTYMSNEGKLELVHIESDVVIAKDFPFQRFQNQTKNLAYPLISEERGVGSVIYMRGTEGSKLLTANLVSEAEKNRNTTEMLSLRQTYDIHKEKIQVLPIGPPVGKSYRNISNDSRANLVASFGIFQGLFDGVEIGQYFFGTDPRNRRGRTLIRHDIVNGYCNLADWSLVFNDTRGFPSLRFRDNFEERSCDVFALHLPTKERGLFNFRSQVRLMKRKCLDSRNPMESRLLLGFFISSLVTSIIRRISLVSRFKGRRS